MLKSYFAFLLDAVIVTLASGLYSVLYVTNMFNAEDLDFFTSIFSAVFFSIALIYQFYQYSKIEFKKLHFSTWDIISQITCCFVFFCYSVAPTINLFDKAYEPFEGLSSLWLLFAAIISVRISYDDLRILQQGYKSSSVEISNNQNQAA